MKATGIIRRVDDIGRVGIPKEIRNNLRMKEGEPLEIFVDNDMVCFKKYSNDMALAEKCREIVENCRKDISAIIPRDDKITIVLHDGGIGEAVRNKKDIYDLNVGIAYALIDSGMVNSNILEGLG